MPVFQVRVHRALGMVAGIFDAFDCSSLESLVSFREFFHAFFVRIFNQREFLQIA